MSKYSFVLVVITVIAGAFILGGCPKKPEETSQEGAPQSIAASSEHGASPTSGTKGGGSGEEGATPAERASLSSEGLKPVYFDFDKAFIRHDAKSVMRANAEWLKAHPSVHVAIEGNCDERGTIEYNQALGQRRAASAKKYLTDLGVSAHRIRTISFGKEKPACVEHDEDCWQKNRRDDFAVGSR